MLEKVKYNIKKNAQAKSIRISIYEDARVGVTAPRWVPKKMIEKFIEQKKDWIEKSLQAFGENKKEIKTKGSRSEFERYKKRAKQLAVKKAREINKVYNFKYNRITIRFVQTRWGSCSSQGNLNFSYRLVFLPEHLIDYLVAHELSHLQEMNHSIRFWRLVEKAVPDYKKCELELKKFK